MAATSLGFALPHSVPTLLWTPSSLPRRTWSRRSTRRRLTAVRGPLLPRVMGGRLLDHNWSRMKVSCLQLLSLLVVLCLGDSWKAQWTEPPIEAQGFAGHSHGAPDIVQKMYDNRCKIEWIISPGEQLFRALEQHMHLEEKIVLQLRNIDPWEVEGSRHRCTVTIC